MTNIFRALTQRLGSGLSAASLDVSEPLSVFGDDVTRSRSGNRMRNMRSSSSTGGRNAARLWRTGANLVESAHRLLPKQRPDLQKGASQISISEDAQLQCDPVCPTLSGGSTCSKSSRGKAKVMNAIRAARNIRQLDRQGSSQSKASSEVTDICDFRERIVNLTGFVGLHQEILANVKEDERASLVIKLQRLREELASDAWSIVERSWKSREGQKPESKARTAFRKLTDKRPVPEKECCEHVKQIEDLEVIKKELRQKLCNSNAQYLRELTLLREQLALAGEKEPQKKKSCADDIIYFVPLNNVDVDTRMLVESCIEERLRQLVENGEGDVQYGGFVKKLIDKERAKWEQLQEEMLAAKEVADGQAKYKNLAQPAFTGCNCRLEIDSLKHQLDSTRGDLDEARVNLFMSQEEAAEAKKELAQTWQAVNDLKNQLEAALCRESQLFSEKEQHLEDYLKAEERNKLLLAAASADFDAELSTKRSSLNDNITTMQSRPVLPNATASVLMAHALDLHNRVTGDPSIAKELYLTLEQLAERLDFEVIEEDSTEAPLLQKRLEVARQESGALRTHCIVLMEALMEMWEIVQAKGVPDKMKVARLAGKLEQVVHENRGLIKECFKASHRGWCKLEEARQQARNICEEHSQQTPKVKVAFEGQIAAQSEHDNHRISMTLPGKNASSDSQAPRTSSHTTPQRTSPRPSLGLTPVASPCASRSPSVAPSQADVCNGRDNDDDMPATTKLLNVPQDPRQQKMGRSKLAMSGASAAATPRPLSSHGNPPVSTSPRPSSSCADSPGLRAPRSRHDTQPALNTTSSSKQCAQGSATGSGGEKVHEAQRKKTTTAINPTLDSKAGVQVRVSVPEQPKSSPTVSPTAGLKRRSAPSRTSVLANA